MRRALLVFACLPLATALAGKPRARELGIPFRGTPGKRNAITDVTGVEVGQVTLKRGESRKGVINGVVRTGVTAVWPRGNKSLAGVPAGWYSENANGEMAGVHVIDESGLLEGPVVMTNTQSLGTVRDAVSEWFIRHFPIVDEAFLPVVGETDDSWLNDLYGFHVKREHVFEALDGAKGGDVEEGSVGAGTGDVTFHFKAGIGTASRKLSNGYTIGALVQSNFGKRDELQIAGIPIGPEIKDLEIVENPFPKMYPVPKKRAERSIVIVLATDAPLLPHQLKRIARRAGYGMARLGSLARNTSGEFFLAFSTVPPKKKKNGTEVWTGMPIETMDLFFDGAIQSVEEAILNALAAGETMDGVNGNKVYGMPWDRVQAILKRHGRLETR